MESPANHRLAISEDLTIYNAMEHKRRLMAMLDKTLRMELDLSAVQAVDAAGLQLLILVKREAAARGASVELVGHSEALRSVIELCNMAASFGDPLLMPAAS